VDKKTDWTPFDWSKVPSYTKDGKMIIDNADIFERVIRKIQDETGANPAEIMDAINNDDEYIVVPETFDEVYKRFFG
jgi:hypothetical protein